MTPPHRTFVLGLALLLAAATAAADTVITANEVISCSVVSADTNFVRLKFPQGGIRMLNTRDVREIRLADSSRVAELAVRLPGLRTTLDATRPAPPPSVPASNLLRRAGMIDTLARNASPAVMAARCRDMYAALRACGRSNDTLRDLFIEVSREQEALRRIWPQVELTYSLYVPTVGLLSWLTGGLVSCVIDPCGSNPVGPIVGCVAGSLGGAAIGAWQSSILVARHRDRVSDLIRWVNRAVAPATLAAAADTVVTAIEVISRSVVSADTNIVTDSIGHVPHADSLLAGEPEPLAPQAGDSVGVSSAAPTVAPEPPGVRAFRPVTPLVVAGESGAGCLGGLGLGFLASVVGSQVGVLIAGRDANFPDRLVAWIDGSNYGMLVGYAAGNALFVSIAGWKFDQGGRLWASACGALVGTLVALPLFSVDSMQTPLVLAMPLLPMAGAVIGYNLSRPKPAPVGSVLNRLEMPAVALWLSEQQTAGVNVRFVCVRF